MAIGKDYFSDYHQAQQIVSLIRQEVINVLFYENKCDLLSKQKHLTKLQRLIEYFRLYLCGNFHLEADSADYCMEREFIANNMLGYFIFNVDKFNNKICQNYVEIFMHIVHKYAYGTRRPFVERIQNRGQILFERLFYFLLNKPDVSFFASKMLSCCSQQKTLAFKMIDFHGFENDSDVPIYIILLRTLIQTNHFNQLVQIFKLIRVLFLVNMEVANYVLHRDLHVLIELFNRMFQCHNYYVRLSSMDLFAKLIQTRHLQKLIMSYTTDLDNFHLTFHLMIKADQADHHSEFVKLFQIVRLFILNRANDKNHLMKEMFRDHYITLFKAVGKVQRLRSYTDIALFTPEYDNVITRLNQIANIQQSNHQIHSDSDLDFSALGSDSDSL